MLSGTQGVSRALQIGGWLALVAIAALSLAPGGLRPHVVASNHVEHAAAYFGAAALFASSCDERRRLLWSGLALTVYGGCLEIAQIWIPGRMAKVTDFAASAAGVWLAIGPALIWHWARDTSRRPVRLGKD